MTDTKIKRIDYDDHPEFATGQVWSQAEMKWIEAALEAARQIALKGRADNSLATVKALCDERDELRAKLAEAEAREATLYAEVQGMRESTEVFGLYSAEAAGLAFEGVLSAMTDMAKSPSEALTALLTAERERCAKVCERFENTVLAKVIRGLK